MVASTSNPTAEQEETTKWRIDATKMSEEQFAEVREDVRNTDEPVDILQDNGNENSNFLIKCETPPEGGKGIVKQ